MKTVTDSTGISYKESNGTCYNIDTTDEMVNRLERIRGNRTRCRFYFGDTVTGRDWGDIHYVKGRIGRSTGRFKIPLLVYNRRSMGGGGLLSDCIVRIETTQGGHVLYSHENYHTG